MKLFKARLRLDVRHKYCSNRIVEDRNGLPEEVITVSTIDTFKKKLDRHWWDARFAMHN